VLGEFLLETVLCSTGDIASSAQAGPDAQPHPALAHVEQKNTLCVRKSEPKRATFLPGERVSCRTPALTLSNCIVFPREGWAEFMGGNK
jgi:hypothetical protein